MAASVPGGRICKIDCSSVPRFARCRANSVPTGDAESRNVRVPSGPARRLPNTCSPRRPQAARLSARSASWCARPSTRPRRSRRWVRQGLRCRICTPPPPPPRASTRTAGHSVVTRASAGQDRSRLAHRSASRRYPIARRGATEPARRRPVWEDGRAGRAGAHRATSSNALGPPAGGPSAWGGQASASRRAARACRRTRWSRALRGARAASGRRRSRRPRMPAARAACTPRAAVLDHRAARRVGAHPRRPRAGTGRGPACRWRPRGR